MTSSAYMYEQWDTFGEPRVERVVRIHTGENNWQEPFRYFEDVHGITVETVAPDWPPSSSREEAYHMTAGEWDRESTTSE